MQFNPKIGFVLGILVTIEIAVSSGTLSLTHAVPADWIPSVTAWSGILAFMGSTVLTFLHGYSSGDVGPLVKAGTTSSQAYTHESLLATFEEAFGLARLANAAQVPSPINDVWK